MEQRDDADAPDEITEQDLDTVAGGLTKSGAGTLTLSGTNAYTGATTVNAGTKTPQSSTGGQS